MVFQWLRCLGFLCQIPTYCTMLDDCSKSYIQDSTLCHVTYPLTATGAPLLSFPFQDKLLLNPTFCIMNVQFTKILLRIRSALNYSLTKAGFQTRNRLHSDLVWKQLGTKKKSQLQLPREHYWCDLSCEAVIWGKTEANAVLILHCAARSNIS